MARLAAASFLASFAPWPAVALRFVVWPSDNQSTARARRHAISQASVPQSMRQCLTERTERPVSAITWSGRNGDRPYPRRDSALYRLRSMKTPRLACRSEPLELREGLNRVPSARGRDLSACTTWLWAMNRARRSSCGFVISTRTD